MELFNCKENEELWKRLMVERMARGYISERSCMSITYAILRHCEIKGELSTSLEELLGFDRDLWKEYLENNIKTNGIQL